MIMLVSDLYSIYKWHGKHTREPSCSKAQRKDQRAPAKDQGAGGGDRKTPD